MARNPDLQMMKILDTKRLVALDDLYLTVVVQSLVSIESDSEKKSNWMQVIGTIAAVRAPLTVVEMDALLDLPTKSLATTCQVTLAPAQSGRRGEEGLVASPSVFDS